MAVTTDTTLDASIDTPPRNFIRHIIVSRKSLHRHTCGRADTAAFKHAPEGFEYYARVRRKAYMVHIPAIKLKPFPP